MIKAGNYGACTTCCVLVPHSFAKPPSHGRLWPEHGIVSMNTGVWRPGVHLAGRPWKCSVLPNGPTGPTALSGLSHFIHKETWAPKRGQRHEEPMGGSSHWLRSPGQPELPGVEEHGDSLSQDHASLQMSPELCLHFPGVPSACKQVVSVETTRDIEWATYTCTLGFHVFGKFPAASIQFKHKVWLLSEYFSDSCEISQSPVLSSSSVGAWTLQERTLQLPGEEPERWVLALFYGMKCV